MNERRHNWKGNLTKDAQERAAKRHALLLALDETRREIEKCKLGEYDGLKLKQREVVAQLATL
jgi:hypothetical protein